jgi:hypothetical protein
MIFNQAPIHQKGLLCQNPLIFTSILESTFTIYYHGFPIFGLTRQDILVF